jgi:leader peptidase (prepilin peptidase)/N-methyltransferase
VGASFLEVDRHEQQATGDRITAAWRAAGAPARTLTVAGAAACAGLAFAWPGDSAAVVGCALSLLVLVVAALVDAVEHRLPNKLVAAAALPVVTALAVAGSADLVRDAALGSALVAGPLLATHLVTPAGMGFGDVKAGAVLGAAVGLLDVEVALLALVLGLGFAAAWGLGRRARSVALGPALVGGALVAAWIGVAA